MFFSVLRQKNWQYTLVHSKSWGFVKNGYKYIIHYYYIIIILLLHYYYYYYRKCLILVLSDLVRRKDLRVTHIKIDDFSP